MSKSTGFYSQPKHLVAVDCVVFGYEDDELKLLLYNRDLEPAKGSTSLVGGFVQEDESIEDAARRVLLEITGLENIFLEQVSAFSEVSRDLAERVISIAFAALIRVDEYNHELVKKMGAYWVPVKEVPQLIFDHNQMVDNALEFLQKKSSYDLTGKELLPDKFTLTELRLLYEAIFQRPFDPGNFRKKILSLNLLERLNEKDRQSSKKGAFYYQFKKNEEITIGDRIFKIH
ncbi:NUDIX hydrolase [Natronoflexus pectinivorans]|uniref:ADP-ribose pyrophosphatase YjhB (NUDIX family) n=1 Tax=Natronoflexus pectinivorans TaxID=682526 RepID=A0A4V2RWK0_9BACT|nr:NUDIX domain-containing protein [Natronoflexus pectinivorans]TCO08858.1 ADP-ribose pyrophosphatase YjhB (NUDIX family) [Natronoflexus pectinivorans]